jgi:hypothetical protein
MSHPIALSEQQRSIVNAQNGALYVKASAGSGQCHCHYPETQSHPLLSLLSGNRRTVFLHWFLSFLELYTQIKKSKTQFAPVIAEQIIKSKKPLPPKIIKLFDKISSILNITEEAS